MEEIDREEIDREMKRIDASFAEMEKQGMRDILRYFDRIHDKLFSFNNMLIAGYFVLIVMPQSSASPWWILLPIFNMLYLILIEYRMMEKSRTEAQYTKISAAAREKYGKSITNNNLSSLLTIVLTLGVTLVFVIQVVSACK